MLLRKWQKQIRKDMVKLMEKVPKYHTRSEYEMEKILHRYKVAARRRQIKLAKDDAKIPSQPYPFPPLIENKPREKLIKVGLMYLRLLLP